MLLRRPRLRDVKVAHMIGGLTLLPYKGMDNQNNYSYQTFGR